MAAIAGCAPQSEGEGDDSHVVGVDAGRLRGSVRDGYRLFQGIPYAAPPTGDRRWRPPEPPAAWDGVRDATLPGSPCPQPAMSGAAATGREDCLFLNVWAPERRSGAERLPVMVWVHGGSYTWGSGDAYPAQRLATQGDIVVVTINYRLGALGYLAHPALANGRDAGNYGLMDQQAALRWVKGNIGAFGGDPGKVTVAGESAGSASVCGLLNSPASKGLFRAAVMESGPCAGRGIGAAQEAATVFATSLGCFVEATAADCLRALPASALTGPPKRGGGARTVSALPDTPASAVSGLAYGTSLLPGPAVGAPTLKVPVLIGTNHDEVTYVLKGKVQPKDFAPGLEALYGDKAKAVARAYPRGSHDDDAGLAYGHAVTDGDYACRTRHVGRAFAPYTKVYAYEFADPDPVAWSGVQQLFGTKDVGAAHATELPYLFDFPGVTFTEKQRKLSDRMIGYWSSFVSGLDPNGGNRAHWYPYRAATDSFLSLRPTGSVTINNFGTDHHCGFWQPIVTGKP
ncbi:carboxylesterase [Streptomyces griseocarneus]|nr:carboxylesterase [Streptomyces griseocarneus]